MGRKPTVSEEAFRIIAAKHTVQEAAVILGLTIGAIYAYERRTRYRCLREKTRSDTDFFEQGRPTSIPDYLHENIRRMYEVGHPPGAIAALRGLNKEDVCALLQVPIETGRRSRDERDL